VRLKVFYINEADYRILVLSPTQILKWTANKIRGCAEETLSVNPWPCYQ